MGVMRVIPRPLGAIVVILFLLNTAVSVGALDSLTVHSGLLLVHNAESDGPPDLLAPPIGVWIPVTLPAPAEWSWEAGAMLVGMTYRYEDDRGVPAEVEAANSFWVAGLIGDLRMGRLWKLKDGMDLVGYAGLSVFLRIPLIAHDDASQDRAALTTFLLMRSLYPEIGGSFRWEIMDDLKLVFDLRALYPLLGLFDSGTPSLIDHLTVGLLVGVEISLR